MMADQLARHGVAHVLKPIDNGEPGFGGGNPRQIEDAYKAMREFVEEHLSERWSRKMAKVVATHSVATKHERQSSPNPYSLYSLLFLLFVCVSTAAAYTQLLSRCSVCPPERRLIIRAQTKGKKGEMS
jgi:hypothetical protein